MGQFYKRAWWDLNPHTFRFVAEGSSNWTTGPYFQRTGAECRNQTGVIGLATQLIITMIIPLTFWSHIQDLHPVPLPYKRRLHYQSLCGIFSRQYPSVRLWQELHPSAGFEPTSLPSSAWYKFISRLSWSYVWDFNSYLILYGSIVLSFKLT